MAAPLHRLQRRGYNQCNRPLGPAIGNRFMPPPGRTPTPQMFSLIRFARYCWVAPCTALGLCAAAPAFAFGGTAKVVDGVLEVPLSRNKRPNAILGALPFNAITLGHVVIAKTQVELERLRSHEHAHVRQYEFWGVFFLLAYPAASFWQMLKGRRAYSDNWFEVQARRTAWTRPIAHQS